MAKIESYINKKVGKARGTETLAKMINIRFAKIESKINRDVGKDKNTTETERLADREIERKGVMV